MSQAPPPYTQQPMPYYGNGQNYHPQAQNPYPQGQYPQGYYNPNQPQVIYVQEPPRRQQQSDNNCWLTSLFALCCGCLVGEVCCDSPMLCCVLPCPIRLPRLP
ncbi:unnamed protein product [Caenorhabditis angaria]|uniref:Cysteine-rich transmembrane CYSTM domain-containing protein n=1 Tax=Caenorhabditis angaria TaxID=860376 RepID=A0A9P1IQ89_9PELO|nr:unnamed protein product [Caenorhabditis angaria]